MQPPPAGRLATPVSASPSHTVARLSGTAQPTVTVVCVVAVSPSAYVTVSFAV